MGEDENANDPEDEEEEKSDRTVVARNKETGERIEGVEVNVRPKDTEEDDEK